MALIGELPRYYGAHHDWPLFVENLERIFDINHVAEDKKKAFLINCLYDPIHDTLRDICFPDVPKDKTYDELCELMNKHFGKPKSVFAERCKFYDAKQEENESVQDWFRRIKKLSLNCRLCEQYADIVLDRFITGLRVLAIRDRLCENEIGKLTIEHALEIATAKEEAIREIK